MNKNQNSTFCQYRNVYFQPMGLNQNERKDTFHSIFDKFDGPDGKKVRTIWKSLQSGILSQLKIDGV